MVVSIYQVVNHSVDNVDIFYKIYYAYNYATVFICTHTCTPDVYIL